MDRKLNILFIHEVDYFGKPIYEIHEFPEHLAKRGHSVTFLEFNEVSRNPKAARSRTISGRVLPEIKLTLETPFYIGLNAVDRILAVFTCIPKLFSLLRRQEFDVVVLYAVPTFGPQALLISRMFGLPLAHRALDVPHKIRKSVYEPLIGVAEKIVYKYSPEITANNVALAAYCDSVGHRSTKSKVHLPPVDLVEFTKKPRPAKLASSLRISGASKVIAYLGSFFYFSGLPQVIKDFQEATNSDQTLRLMLIGGGEQNAELKSLVTELGLEEKVIFTGFIPFSQIPEYLALANVAINPMENVMSANLALPHKIFQYLACGLPVVSTKLTGIHEALGDLSGVSWVDSPSQILGAAVDMLDNEEAYKVQTQRAANSLLDLFDMNKVIGDFEGFLFQLVDKKGPK